MEVHSKKSLLILFITCSLSEERAKIAVEVTKSITEHFPEVSNFARLINLDNGSKFKQHLNHLPEDSLKIMFNENIGYWQALYWFLNAEMKLVDVDSFKYIYIIESDNFHYSLGQLGEIINFMDENVSVISTRTQEFSVKFRWRYNKALRWIPFRKVRSLITLKNLVNNEKAYFYRAPNYPSIYFTNLHTKLPAVNRLVNIKRAFRNLQELSNFTESDFFRFMNEKNYESAVLDKGIFYTLIKHSDSKSIESGSWIDNFEGKVNEYLPTRYSKIEPLDHFVYEKIGIQ